MKSPYPTVASVTKLKYVKSTGWAWSVWTKNGSPLTTAIMMYVAANVMPISRYTDRSPRTVRPLTYGSITIRRPRTTIAAAGRTRFTLAATTSAGFESPNRPAIPRITASGTRTIATRHARRGARATRNANRTTQPCTRTAATFSHFVFAAVRRSETTMSRNSIP